MIFVQEENGNDTDNNYRSCGKRSVQHNKRFSEEKKMSGSAKHWALKEYKQRGEHLKRKMDDVHKVVFCKDCKYWEVDNDVGFCTRTEDCDWNADDFCSRGVKK